MEPQELGAQIRKLSSAVPEQNAHGTDWKAVWAMIRSIGSSFKDTRFPSKEERELAWKQFQTIVSRVKALQTEYFEGQDLLYKESGRLKDKICEMASNATPSTLDDLGNILVPIAVPVNIAMDSVFGPSDHAKARLEGYSRELREVWGFFSANKGSMRGADKGVAYAALSKAQERLDYEWEKWKRERGRLHKSQVSQRAARQEAWTARQREWEQKQAQWRSNQVAYIERLEQGREKLASALERRTSHLDDLREKRSSAKSEEHRNRVDAWIDEERDRIADIRSKLNELDGKIDEAKGRL